MHGPLGPSQVFAFYHYYPLPSGVCQCPEELQNILAHLFACNFSVLCMTIVCSCLSGHFSLVRCSVKYFPVLSFLNLGYLSKYHFTNASRLSEPAPANFQSTSTTLLRYGSWMSGKMYGRFLWRVSRLKYMWLPKLRQD